MTKPLRKKYIKAGNWVCLDNMPVLGNKTVRQVAEETPRLIKRRYYKIVTVNPLQCEIKMANYIDRFQVFMKWITDISNTYIPVKEQRI